MTKIVVQSSKKLLSPKQKLFAFHLSQSYLSK